MIYIFVSFIWLWMRNFKKKQIEEIITFEFWVNYDFFTKIGHFIRLFLISISFFIIFFLNIEMEFKDDECIKIRSMIVTIDIHTPAKPLISAERVSHQLLCHSCDSITFRLLHCQITHGFWYLIFTLFNISEYFSIYDEADDFHTLEISRARVEHSGTYTISAANSSGSVSCKCDLIVDKGIRSYVEPRFVQKLDTCYSVTEDAQLRIKATVQAYPIVGITWYDSFFIFFLV